MASPSPAGGATPAANPMQFRITTILLYMAAVAVILAGYSWRPSGHQVLVTLGAVIWVAVCISRNQTLATLFALGLLALSIPPCLLSFGEAHQGPPRAAHCRNNLRQIALALHTYEAVYKQFPPPYVADAQGRPMHSWRVLLLPYIEQEALYKKYKFDEPWDGPNNRKLHDDVVACYRCPAEDETVPATMTSYLAVVGPGTMWDPQRPQVTWGKIRDGSSNTIYVVESCSSGIHWMEPRDLHVHQMKPAVNAQHGQGICSHHSGGAHAAFVDGSVHSLSDTMTADEIRARLSIDGGEVILHP